jgi:phospholipid/cholesterol/gamma-HCH transport system substrate-binding protein
MRKQPVLELTVGIFFLLAIASLFVLAMKVSGLTSLTSPKSYHVYADFSNVGGLKVRAPVTIAGVRVGEVSNINLLPDSFSAKVTLLIDENQNKIPLLDTSARILTEGLLGSNYISIVPGFDSEEGDDKPHYLREGDSIEKTQEAIILENLIGQLLFNINK